jgi:hypothetical protein
MKGDVLERDFAYLALRGDGEGSFKEWLTILGIGSDTNLDPLDAIRWGWLTPSHRVIVPERYFRAWKSYPTINDPDRPGIPRRDVWADHLWYASRNHWGTLFSLAGTLEGEWFIHPFDRPKNPYRAHFRRASRSIPRARKHPNGSSFSPSIEYLPYWRGYQLVDLDTSMRHSFYLGDGARVVAKRIASRLPRVRRRDAAVRAGIADRWAEQAQVFSWLAAYRSLRSWVGVKSSLDPAPITTWSLEAGARALAVRRGVTVDGLATLVEDQLLVLANDWRGTNNNEPPAVGWRAWGQLQKDILCAIEWLCILTGRTGEEWFDRWSPGRRWKGPRPLPLVDAVPYEPFAAETYFVEHFGRVRGGYDLVRGPARIAPDAVLPLVRWLRDQTWVVGAWMRLYRELHDALQGAPSWDWIGGAMPDVVERLVLFALTGEKVLNDVWRLIAPPASPVPDVKAVLKTLALRVEQVDVRFRGAWALAATRWTEFTDLRTRPAKPFDRVRNEPLGDGAPAALARALLGFGVARNYGAHHTYLDGRLVQTPEGKLFVGAVTTTVLYLADGVRRSR